MKGTKWVAPTEGATIQSLINHLKGYNASLAKRLVTPFEMEWKGQRQTHLALTGANLVKDDVDAIRQAIDEVL